MSLLITFAYFSFNLSITAIRDMIKIANKTLKSSSKGNNSNKESTYNYDHAYFHVDTVLLIILQLRVSRTRSIIVFKISGKNEKKVNFVMLEARTSIRSRLTVLASMSYW